MNLVSRKKTGLLKSRPVMSLKEVRFISLRIYGTEAVITRARDTGYPPAVNT